MAHDPFCPYRPEKWHDWMDVDPEIPCHCDYISRIRADERQKVYASLSTRT